MGIYAKLINLDELFESVSTPTTIVNDLDSQTSDQKKDINETIYTTNGDVYNNVPTCQCGEKKGKYRIGSICSNCHTPVSESIEEYLQSLVWIRQPNGVEKLINPQIWLMLKRKFTIGAFCTLTYLTDNGVKFDKMVLSNKKVMRLKYQLVEAGLDQRGYNHFIQNFDRYMEFLFNSDVFKPKRKEVDKLYNLIYLHKDKVFTSYIPIPNKSLLIIEDTNYGSFIDKSLTLVLNAVRLMTGIDRPDAISLTEKSRENRVSKALNNISDYCMQTYKELFSPKPGIFRKQIYGTRVDYSFRTVISSLSGKHRYDEIHIPWPVGINVLYNHIVSKLLHRGYSPTEAFSFINKYNLEYNEEMETILKELINEAGPRGIPCLGNRNPSLGRGSIQRHYITKIKTDPQDITTSISLLCCPSYNSDRVLLTMHDFTVLKKAY